MTINVIITMIHFIFHFDGKVAKGCLYISESGRDLWPYVHKRTLVRKVKT